MTTITSSRANGLSIGDLSKRTGVNVETIRYYERIDLLPAPPRRVPLAVGEAMQRAMSEF